MPSRSRAAGAVTQDAGQPALPADLHAAEEDREPHGENETILLVEDDEAVRKFIRNVLEARGYVVMESSNGREALAVLKNPKNMFGLVISDVVMPELGGQALSKWLRENRPSLPALVISGYTANAATRDGSLGSGEHILQKPFTPADLCRKVRQMLDA